MKSSRPPRNLAASVRQRLLNLAKEKNEDFQLVLTRYALERTMYRLSRSPYNSQFVLKGAMLFSLWSDEPHRATRDLDLLGRGSSDLSSIENIFQEIIAVTVEQDGLEFFPQSLKAERIKEDQQYEGVRVRFEVRLAAARIPVQIDIGFGDAITPDAVEIDFPTLLDYTKPRLLAYTRETVIAEKFQALVVLGIANTRMKDFYDIWALAKNYPFQGRLLSQAVKATFDRRQTPLPVELPLALTQDFYNDESKQAQWLAFISRNRLEVEEKSLADVVALLRDFLMPLTLAIIREELFDLLWRTSGQWSE